jgi:hypothetical protein
MNFLHTYRLAILLVLSSSMMAYASSARTYISVSGSDGNTGTGCTLAAPCRSFGAALSVTMPFGDVVAVDSGDYAPVTISQSVTLQSAPGVAATIVSPTGNAITITAGGGDIVVLRRLSMNGVNMGPTGIRFTAGKVLSIENCSIVNFMSNGISMEAGGVLNIKDTEVQNTVTAIRLQSSSGMVHAAIDRVHLEHNIFGLFVAANSQATIRNSFLSDNGNDGMQVGDTSGSSELNVEDCVVQGSNTGIFAGGAAAIVRVSHSTIVDNSTGLSSAGGAPLLTYGNNSVAGNGTNGSFTGSVPLQ